MVDLSALVNVPQNPEEVPAYLQNAIPVLVAALTSAGDIQRTLNVVPVRPSEGMIRYADGTNWNPGSGAGLYRFDGTNWILLVPSTYAGLAPAGAMFPYGGTSAPTGWLLCNGAAVSRTTYAALFAVIGTAFGVGNGSTTFNVPDLQQRFPLGKAAAGTGSTLGGTGGGIDHTHTTGDHALTVAEMPSHSHSSFSAWAGTGNDGAAYPTISGRRDVNNVGVTPGISGAGGGGVHNHGATGTGNPPFLSVNFIIKT